MSPTFPFGASELMDGGPHVRTRNSFLLLELQEEKYSLFNEP